MHEDLIPLIDGYRKFQDQYYGNCETSTQFKSLIEDGQSPNILLITCSDSRLDPAHLFGCSPGDLFVVRNVANIVPPFDIHPRHHSTSAALEFAIHHLKVKHIIILGHGHCGGIRAYLSTHSLAEASSQKTSFIYHWMEIVKDAKRKVLDECAHMSFDEQTFMCEEEALRVSMNNLRSFPWIESKVAQGDLSLHAWYFDLPSGTMRGLNEISDQFEDLVTNNKHKT